MKTLFVSYRVTDLDRSLAFYTALGYVAIQADTLAPARLVIPSRRGRGRRSCGASTPR
jgi:lactoylglutathione lyase